ncbi:MAG: exodeoxyribonuclease V subunit alpha [Gammaproteobacteria bacterium]
MSSLLHHLARNGDISWLSYYFAEFVARQAQSGIDDLLSLSAALVSEANQRGNVCIELGRFDQRPLFDSNFTDATEIPCGIDSASWCAHLRASPCVGGPNESAPLTLDGERLYLNRYWNYEEQVASRIRAMLEIRHDLDNERISQQVEQIFADSGSIDQDQKHSVATAARNHFCVVSGGPGSGKTSTVIRILAVLTALDPDIRIALVAPTGKAAARMMDSISQRISHIDMDPAVRDALPTTAGTIHRLLGYRRHGYRYHEHHPLALDCVVVDEASMIDLKLMFHLLTALPATARLILLGDRDQLASVAAGNVLGDITGHGIAFEPASVPLAASIALLRNNYRFDHRSAIGEVAAHVNRGQSKATLELLRLGDRGLRWYAEGDDQIHADAMAWLYAAYEPIFDRSSPAEALEVYEKTRVLCATNQGPLGVKSLNLMISRAMLARNNLPDSDLYAGLPILIKRNHHELGLFNGDTGILWQYSSGLRACFRDSAGDIRDLAVNRLPEFAPAWASTVHKSQGSEFDSVFLILPSDQDSEALSRELLYTAITRARQQFILHAPERVVISSIESLTQRHSGLSGKLGWPY